MADLVRRENSSAVPSRSPIGEWDPFRQMTELLRWDPFREFGRVLGADERISFVPRFDVRETNDAYVFMADLPGVREQDLDIHVTGTRLTISGRREIEEHKETRSYYALERGYGAFTRSFTLPEGINPNQVQAELKDGVLTVNVPKSPELQPHRIQVRGAGKQGEKAKA